ncbi:tetratricopeptide repeat protein [Longispora sp. NPDC051575]|uniref:tetratricopeptide repeat protein n=1 Tax=Longispora sp. NPDC051575 TaxID=3154943 RepID=UPI0034381091
MTDLERARELWKLDREADALPLVVRHLAAEPESAAGWRLLANCQSVLGGRDEALAAARRGFHLDPEEPWSHWTLSDVEALHGRTAEAVDLSRSGLRLWPQFWYGHTHLARRLLLADQATEARRHIARALELEPEMVWSHTVLAEIEEYDGDAASAIAQWRQVLALEPDNADAMQRLSSLQLRTGRVGTALSGFTTAAGLEPEDPLHALHVSWGLRLLLNRLYYVTTALAGVLGTLWLFSEVDQPARLLVGGLGLAGVATAAHRTHRGLPRGAKAQLAMFVRRGQSLFRTWVATRGMAVVVVALAVLPRLPPIWEWH